MAGFLLAGLAGIDAISFGFELQEDCSQPAGHHQISILPYGMLVNRIQALHKEEDAIVATIVGRQDAHGV